MKLENHDFDGIEVKFADSGTDSKLNLLILPGVEGAKAWKNQYRYFKTDFRTIILEAIDRNKENYIESVKKFLKHKNISNCVLIGANLSNFVIDEVKNSGRISSTVYTDSTRKMPEIKKSVYKGIKELTEHPKILKKLAFAEKTDYSTAKSFRDDVDSVDWEEFRSYFSSEIKGDAANALLIEPDKSRFSSDDVRRILEPDIGISRISSGSFCFYEKPEEYNKALYDFIAKLQDFQEKAKVREKRESNRTLTDFDKRNSGRNTRKVRK